MQCLASEMHGMPCRYSFKTMVFRNSYQRFSRKLLENSATYATLSR